MLLAIASPAFSQDKIAVKTDDVEIKFNALTQMWLTSVFGREKPPPDEWHTYKIRRSQLQFSGYIDKNKFKWLMMVDFSADQENPLQDLYVELSYVPKITLKAGQFKPPFLMENLTPDNQLDFVDRSFIVRTFADVRDIGFILYTKLKHFEAYAGEVNGTGPNTSDWGGDKDLIGRVVIKPVNGLTFGASSYLGDFYSSDFVTMAGEMNFVYENFGLRTETIWIREDTSIIRAGTLSLRFPIILKKNVDRWGGYATLLYKLLEKHQLGVRFEWLEPNNGNSRDARFIITVGYNFFQTHRVKWQANIQSQVEQQGIRANRNIYFGVVSLQVSF